ncbi:MAG: hypothetical protein ACREI8_15860, partial [Myxococcota bacterium]
MSAPEAASLTSALLVRKGAAVPAGYATLAATVRGLRVAEVSPSEGAPLAPGEAGAKRPRRRSAPDPRTRISLRLDDERHLKLKLTAAHLQKKLQDIVIAALDGYLDQVGPAVMS